MFRLFNIAIVYRKVALNSYRFSNHWHDMLNIFKLENKYVTETLI